MYMLSIEYEEGFGKSESGTSLIEVINMLAVQFSSDIYRAKIWDDKTDYLIFDKNGIEYGEAP